MSTKIKKIVVASSNPGKLREISAILNNYRVVPQSEFEISDAEETGRTFVENAIIKARNASLNSDLPALADDSGLEVDALNGAPGVYSARYAGPGASDADNLNELLSDMKDVEDTRRSARYRCLLVLLRSADDPSPLIAEGVWEGSIRREPAGSNGFGYDPIFWVPECNCTSAELAPELKNTLSHRAQALKALTALL